MKTSVLKLSAFAFAAALAWQSSSALADTPLFSPPQGFWIAHTKEKGGLYSPSRPDANWHFAQWKNPDGDVSPFDAQKVARGQSLAFHLENGAYRIDQRGARLPCREEFDAFAAPNNRRTYKKEPSAELGQSKPLSEMRYLHHRIAVKPIEEKIVEKNCKATQGVYMSAIVFTNQANKQTFFYQLRLRTVGMRSQPTWWATGQKGRFGFGDTLDHYGKQNAELGRESTFDLDLLPRISALIRSGEHGIDTDLSHWRVSHAYHGQAMWGNMVMSSEWSRFSLASD